jgi:DNA-binding NarL/FixJ family response regulator
MANTQLLLFADELRTRAREILIRATNTDDREAQTMMRVVAAGYVKLARRAEQLGHEARQSVAPRRYIRGRSVRASLDHASVAAE